MHRLLSGCLYIPFIYFISCSFQVKERNFREFLRNLCCQSKQACCCVTMCLLSKVKGLCYSSADAK